MTPLVVLGVQPTLKVVQASMTVADVKEFIALARSNPGKFNYGNFSTGSAGHFVLQHAQALDRHSRGGGSIRRLGTVQPGVRAG
ncbi:MAG: hypothetical protein H7274_12430 [Rhodoferax sp.]|nr:hypothetical protein [Rhodoferax sp.]